jgi:hypothetical protein
MTTIEILSSLKTIRAGADALRANAATSKQNPAWAAVATGAIDTAIHELGQHLKYNEKLNPDGTPIVEPAKT